MITTQAFWLGALERAVKTFCQVFLAVAAISLGGTTVGVDAGLSHVDWSTVLSVSVLATFFSLVTSVGNARFTAGAEVTPASADTVVINQPTGDPAVTVADLDRAEATQDRVDAEVAAYRRTADTEADAAYHPQVPQD